MSYADGVISITTSGGVTYGVSVYDLQRALGRGTGDVGQLCSDQELYDNNGTPTLRRVYKVNGWAKYKSVRSDKLGLMTDSDFQDVYFGMNVPIYGTGQITNRANFCTAFDSGWEYLPPRGKGQGANGADEWFRIRDFEGYNVAARCFVFPEGSTFPTRYLWGRSDAGCRWTIGLNTTAANLKGGIAITDIKLGGHSGTAFSSLYFGLLFVGRENNTTVYKIVTNGTKTLGQSEGNEVFISETNNSGLAGLNTGTTYTVYPVLSRVAHGSVTTLGNAGTDTLVALPVQKFYFHQETIAATTVLTLSSVEAVQKINNSLLVTAKVGMSSTDPGITSIGRVEYAIYPANSYGDTSQTTALVGGTGSVGPVTNTTTDDIEYNNRPTIPNYVRIVISAPDYPTIPAVTEYAQVTTQFLPD